jgi:1,4-alpha-glucan branching enzyme
MGGEIGQRNEWDSSQSLDWEVLEDSQHLAVQRCVQDLNGLYRFHSALWEEDFHSQGFTWIDCADARNSVISYYRKSSQQRLLCIHHFTPATLEGYHLSLEGVQSLREIFNSDAERYGGSGKNGSTPTLCHDEEGRVTGALLTIPPLATMIFEVQ